MKKKLSYDVIDSTIIMNPNLTSICVHTETIAMALFTLLIFLYLNKHILDATSSSKT